MLVHLDATVVHCWCTDLSQPSALENGSCSAGNCRRLDIATRRRIPTLSCKLHASSESQPQHLLLWMMMRSPRRATGSCHAVSRWFPKVRPTPAAAARASAHCRRTFSSPSPRRSGILRSYLIHSQWPATPKTQSL